MTEKRLGPGSPTEQFIRKMRKRQRKSEDKEWSLKDMEEVLDERGLIHLEEDEDYDYFCYYTKKNIDTLREKLIEDMKNIRIPIKGLDDKDVPMQEFICHLYELYDKEVIKIINKRFGHGT